MATGSYARGLWENLVLWYVFIWGRCEFRQCLLLVIWGNNFISSGYALFHGKCVITKTCPKGFPDIHCRPVVTYIFHDCDKVWQERNRCGKRRYQHAQRTNYSEHARHIGSDSTFIIMTEWMIDCVGCVAQLAERRSLAGELTLSCARSAADGWPLCG